MNEALRPMPGMPAAPTRTCRQVLVGLLVLTLELPEALRQLKGQTW